jgi:hypothetical protein
MPVSPKQSALVLGVILGCAVSVGCSMPNVEPHAAVPGEHSRTILNGSDPTSEPPASRYRLAYESFYWNCVALLSLGLSTREARTIGDRLTPTFMRRAVPLMLGCVLVSSCYVATHFDGWRYKGGRLVNNGLFSRPRFEAPFPAISFNVPGSYEYSFSQFPADDAYVMLVTPSEPAVASIERLMTRVRLRVIDTNGQLRCDATGSPGRTGDEQLIVNSSAGVIGLYHLGCMSLQLRTCNPCRLQIAIGQIDPATPAVSLVPTLQGAGYELP